MPVSLVAITAYVSPNSRLLLFTLEPTLCHLDVNPIMCGITLCDRKNFRRDKTKLFTLMQVLSEARLNHKGLKSMVTLVDEVILGCCNQTLVRKSSEDIKCCVSIMILHTVMMRSASVHNDHSPSA